VQPRSTPASTPSSVSPADAPTDPVTGLTTAEVEVRRARHGPNSLPEPVVRPAWRRFVDQFRSGIIAVLTAAAVVAAAVGELKDPIVIAVVLVANGVLGYIQEGRAEEALGALRRMLAHEARVRRDGEVRVVTAVEVVPGDVVLLEAGDRVPADGRLLVAVGVAADESMLTGESEPRAKDVEPSTSDVEPRVNDAGLDARTGAGGSEARSVGDRHGELFMQTTVVRGRAELLVTATGSATEIGKIAGLLATDSSPETPLERQLSAVGGRLAVLAAAAAALVLGLALLRGETFADALLTAAALAVAAIPEGLPAVVTLTLAVGVRSIARQHAIVKRLPSVETLGSTTVICTDKTGTLTLNQMTASRLWHRGVAHTVDGVGYGSSGGTIDGEHPSSLIDALGHAVLCNDALVRDGELIGDPTEGALVTLAAKGGIDVEALRRRCPRDGEIPFDSATKTMTTMHRTQGGELMVVKGAFDVVVDRCSHLLDAEGRVELDRAGRAAVTAVAEEFAAQGLRVLAVASRGPATEPPGGDGRSDVGELSLELLVGILDPVRPEARDAIARCRGAGIVVKMVTGDHAATARSIATDLGIDGDVVTGAQLDALDEEQLAEAIAGIGVCARVSPTHKVRLVAALQAQGDVVAMTGDGVNDAAALRRADIGVAMGSSGTEVAKDAADLILTDDDFTTIVDAVERGRTIYDNIVTFVRFQLTTNLAAIATFVLAGLVGLPVPFSPVQVLFVNLIVDGPPALSLGADPPKPDLMSRAPTGMGAPVLTARRLAHLGFLAAVMTAGTLGVLAVTEGSTETGSAITMTFTTFVLFQVVNAVNVRNGWHTVFSRRTATNPALWIALVSVTALQVAVVQIGPLADFFGTTPLGAAEWAIAAGAAASLLVLSEVARLVYRQRHEA
jgi:P-type Ca2+ transporter type 2C